MKKILAIFCCLAISGLCAGEDIKNVSVDIGEKTDSVVIDLASSIKPKIFELKEPSRVVIDLNGALWSGGTRQTEVNSPRISSVRWAQNTYNPDNVRVVIVLKNAADRELLLADDGKQLLIKIKDPGYKEAPAAAKPKAKAALPAAEISKAVEVEIKDAGKAAEKPRETIKIDVPTAEAAVAAPTPESKIEKEKDKTPEAGIPFTKEIDIPSTIKIPDLTTLKKFTILVNGKKIDIGKKPYFFKGKLMVPADDLFFICGYSLSYDKKKKTATYTLSTEVQVRVRERSDKIEVNGIERQLSGPARKKSGKLFIPLVTALKWIGYKAIWDGAEKTVYAAPIISSIAWEEALGSRSVVIGSSKTISTYEPEEKKDPYVYFLNIPNRILDVEQTRIPVKEDDVKGIKAVQKKGGVRIGIYLDSEQSSRSYEDNGKLVIYFPPTIKSISFTEEAENIRVDISSTKRVDFQVKKLKEPDRIILDIPGALFTAKAYSEVNKGPVLRIRASQFKTEPFATRVVIDLSRDTGYSHYISDDNKVMSLYIEKKKAEEPKPKPAARSNELKGKVIVIDPGHGGKDPGAFGYSGEYIKEKDVNLSTSLKLAKLLFDSGAEVYLTRDEDMERTLQSRVDFAANNRADIMVSVHYNSSDRVGTSGTETYYYHPNSKLLANLVHKNMLVNLGRVDRGMQKVKFFVIYKSSMPSVLVEPAYLNHEAEERLALDPSFQQKTAESVFEGIKQYFEVLKKIG